MEGLFPIDVWQLHIAPHLDVRTLCALMACSRTSFYLWSSNRTWQHQKRRVCAAYPELEPLFEQHGWSTGLYERRNEQVLKRNANKKRKTPWLMPTSGVWFVFSRFLSLGCDMRGFKELCRFATAVDNKDESVVPLVGAIIRAHVPRVHRLQKCTISYLDEDKRPGSQMFFVKVHVNSQDGPWLYMDVMRGSDEVKMSCWSGPLFGRTKEIYEADPYEHNWFFDAWHYFLLGLPFEPYWTDKFDVLMLMG